jgi:hypothetical protein
MHEPDRDLKCSPPLLPGHDGIGHVLEELRSASTITFIVRTGRSPRARPPGRDHPPATDPSVRDLRRDRLGLIREYAQVG